MTATIISLASLGVLLYIKYRFHIEVAKLAVNMYRRFRKDKK